MISNDTPTRSARELLREVDLETVRLLSTVTPAEWHQQSLCSRWTVRDVTTHLVSGTQASIPSALAALVRHRGRLNQANLTIVEQLTGDMPASELVRYLENHVGHSRGLARLLPAPLLLGDHLVHLLDIAVPLGRQVTLTADVYAAVLRTELRIPNPFVPAARIGRGLTVHADDIGWRSPVSGPVVAGNASDLVLALAGRPEPMGRLRGDGLEHMSRRIDVWLQEAK
jgi:uncharacterized protein (TIGR03083 family)